MVVKFHAFADLPYEDDIGDYLESKGIAPWASLESSYPGIKLNRRFNALSVDQIQELQLAAKQRADHEGRLLSFYMIVCPPKVPVEDLAKEVASWRIVEATYVDAIPTNPTVTPGDDPLYLNQGYLQAAPNGIDAVFAWTVPGGDGKDQNFIDLEMGWTLNHEDLAAQNPRLLYGTIRDDSRDHGTAVLGEICAVDNAMGCVGIVPHVASANVVSPLGANNSMANAILAAVNNLSFGAVLLLEQQWLEYPSGWPKMIIEVMDDVYEAIRTATALGIIVVEAAGNGGHDLDTYTDPSSGDTVLKRASAGFRDSGAIVVGAGSAAFPHARLGFSNHGSRIDCYGWGELVTTTASNPAGATNLYTSRFNGTSSASPIVTGAALAVQGMSEANFGTRFSPRFLRAVLSDPATGTTSANPASDRIGVMPDLQQITGSVLGLTPEIYIRDNVGDIGDPHNGSVASSPDIVIRLAEVGDPQAEFGEGSGTENSLAISENVEAGQDNYIYMRARNRSGIDAVDAIATVFWCHPSTLLTPEHWNHVGSIVMPMIPSGNILTVSGTIPWPRASIPGPGHYCFVGSVSHPMDPAPTLVELKNWNYFVRFIRNNNNTTWKNFNVVDHMPPRGSETKKLPFIARGPAENVPMSLEVVAGLPQGSVAWLEIPECYLRTSRKLVRKSSSEKSKTRKVGKGYPSTRTERRFRSLMFCSHRL